MLKLVVVEDEVWMREALRTVVDWEKIGIDLVGEAEDGEQALELIQLVHPDIVLADIQMPHMDGITLLAELERLEISTHVIIISAYRDFEYARKAMKYGAVDYVLKPIYEDQLIDVVSRCIEDITRHSRQVTDWNKLTESVRVSVPLARRRYLESLIIGDGSNAEDTLKNLKALGIPIEPDQTGAICIQIYDWAGKGDDERSRELIRYAVGNIAEELLCRNWYSAYSPLNGDDADIIIFVSPRTYRARENEASAMQEAGREIIRCLQDYLNLSISIGISLCTSLSSFKRTYDSAVNAASTAFFEGINHYYIKKIESEVLSIPTEPTKEWEHRLLLALRAEETDLVEKLVDEYVAHLEYLKAKISAITISRQARQLFLRIIDNLLLSVNPQGDNLTSALKIKSIWVSERLAINRIKPLLLMTLTVLATSDKLRGTNKRIVDKATSYIQEHYHKRISLKEVAEHLFMSQWHFSKLFHETIGMTFSKYMVQLKLDEAKRLLNETDLKVYEIAENVGYNDFRHFLRTFKEVEGITPVQYRKHFYR